MDKNKEKEKKEDDDVLGLDDDEEDEEFEKKSNEHETHSHTHSHTHDHGTQDEGLINIRDEKPHEHHKHDEKHEHKSDSHEKHSHEEHKHTEKDHSTHTHETHKEHKNPSIPETISSFKGDSHSHSDDEVFKIKKGDFFRFATFILIAIIVIFGFSYFRGGITGNVIGENPLPAAGQPGEVAQVQVGIDDDAIKGNEDAPVTIIEFSDYECPFCARFYAQTLGQIQAEYIDTGKVRLVYRDFPLTNIHPQAVKAAEAAECAGEQGKYYEMHDTLFENGVQGGVSLFKQYAKDIGLDTDSFNECLDSGRMAKEVEKDFSDGQQAGVQGTPAFFINGKIISGAQPFQVFQQAIEAELA